MIQDTLNDRESTHGDYIAQCNLTRALLANMEYSENWEELYPFQKEALHMIAVKVARLLQGDACEPDHWHDIAGYATLVEQSLKNQQYATQERP